MEKLFNTIFPPKCIFCGYFGVVLCYKCLLKCKSVKEGICIVCDGRAVNGFTHVQCLEKGVPKSLHCCFQYEGLVKECIKMSKYGDMEFSVLKKLSEEGVKLTVKDEIYFDGFVSVPIPLSGKRERERGFNQAEVIAKEVCKGFGLKMDASVLKRVKDTRVQSKMDREERKENIRGVFRAQRALGKKILLVDDICTTGSTLLEASRELCGSGALEVRGFALSKKM